MVAFGDVAGFNPWIRRGMNSPEVIHPFIEDFYAEIQSFLIKHPDVQLKYLGDGIMILKELKSSCNRGVCAARFVRDTIALCKRLASIVKACEMPPDGWRMRWTYGHVSKILVLDPADPKRSRKVSEFIGYAINLAQKLLDVSPSIPVIFHESMFNIPGLVKIGFKFRKHDATAKEPRGVDKEDLAGLRVLQS